MSQAAPTNTIFDIVERLYMESLEIEISSQDQYSQMGEYLRTIKRTYKEIDEERKEKVKPVDEQRKKIQDFYNPYLEKLTKTEGFIKKAMLTYSMEQERIRQEEQRKLAEEARKKEAEERARLEKQAEKAMDKGNLEKAEELLEKSEQVHITVPIVEQKVEQNKGQYTVSVWKGRITDVTLIPQAYLLAFFEPVQSKIDKFASSTKGSIAISGIEFYAEQSLRTRT